MISCERLWTEIQVYMCGWSVNILNAITASMSHSIQSQFYLVPGVHSEGRKEVRGQEVFMPMTAIWDMFPWPWGYFLE